MPNIRGESWECVEVIGIPKTIQLKDLEHTVCKVFNRIGFNLGEDRIESCHQLTKSDALSLSFLEEKIINI